MKIYVDTDYEIYTEEEIDEEITQRIKDYNYEGLLDYIANNFTETEIFAMLSPDSQSIVLEHLKESELDNSFLSAKLMNPCLARDVLSQNKNAPRDNLPRGFLLGFWDVIRPNSGVDFFLSPWYNSIRN